MKILVRGDKATEWRFADPVRAKAEAELQELLVESPSLIPIDEIREGVSQLVFAVGEFGLPGSGNTDVLAFSADGDIAIIECKLAANPESKRKVIGQILEYAAYLWGMDCDEVDERIRRMRDASLSELVEGAVAGEWDKDGFYSKAEQTLKSGAFVLIIVVDEINDELKRIIRYINECSQSTFSLHALEVRRFHADGVEILVPHLFGVSTRHTEGKVKRKQWTEDQFFTAVKEGCEPSTACIVTDLYEWAENLADRIWFGTGTETGSFTFHYLRDGKTISVFTVFTSGKITLNYGWMSNQVDQKTIGKFHERIQQIPAFANIAADFSKWPSVNIAAAFSDPGSLEHFKQVVEWLRDTIDSSE